MIFVPQSIQYITLIYHSPNELFIEDGPPPNASRLPMCHLIPTNARPETFIYAQDTSIESPRLFCTLIDWLLGYLETNKPSAISIHDLRTPKKRASTLKPGLTLNMTASKTSIRANSANNS